MIDVFDVVKFIQSSQYQDVLRACLDKIKPNFIDAQITPTSCANAAEIIRNSGLSILNLIQSISDKNFKKFFVLLINFERDVGIVEREQSYTHDMLVAGAIYYYFIDAQMFDELRKFVKKQGFDVSYSENLQMLLV